MRTGSFHAGVEEKRAVYGLQDDDALVEHALAVLSRRLKKPGTVMSSPNVVKDYLRLSLATQEYESFVVLFLDTKYRVIETRELFRGTVTHTSVYPREVVRAVVDLNAQAVILAHNHPSGVPDPSEADRVITNRLVQALSLIDVRVLDHIVVGGDETYSFSQRGEL